MKPVLDRTQSRAFDAHARDACLIPGALLMENAGRGATDVLLTTLLGGAEAAETLLLCGTGNNGGDGFVIARQLLVRGRTARVVVVGEESRISGDALTMLRALRGVRGEVHVVAPEDSIAWFLRESGAAHVLVDALFGTGLERPLSAPFIALVKAMNGAALRRFAVDLPSGLDADTGVARGAAVEAHVTATFAQMKAGLLTPNGAVHAGSVHVVDIGVPAALPPDIDARSHLLDEADLRLLTGPRSVGLHKYGAGHLLVVAGSLGKSGAALLAARGAMRAGAGLVTIASWPDAVPSIELRSLETLTATLPDSGADDAAVTALIRAKRAIVIGPGLGLDDRSSQTVEAFLRSPLPVVLDADALTIVARQPDRLRSRPLLVLTPHAGELSRLLHMTSEEIEADRYTAVRRAAQVTGAVVVLKGAHSLVAAPNGRIAVSPVATSALAVAGSGDVLSGVVGALLCSLAPFEAACAGVLLHGLVGAEWQREFGDRGLLASEIADRIPSLLARLHGATHGMSTTP